MMRRIRTLLSFLSTPANGWLLARMAGWALVLPVLKRVVPLPALARFLWTYSPGHQPQPEREQNIARVARWIYGRRPASGRGHCLERGLLLYRLLSRTHSGVQLVVGMRRMSGGWRGHAWVLVDHQPFDEVVPASQEFSPLFILGPDGRVQPVGTGQRAIQV
jgi:hypothetical protein